MIRDYVQEVRELGLDGTVFRVSWELRTRLGMLDDGVPPESPARLAIDRIPFARPDDVRSLVAIELKDDLLQRAEEAVRGRIRCFGDWVGDFGQPIDWYVNPRTGARWPQDVSWSEALRQPSSDHGDIKLTWEIGRFPQVFDIVRACTWYPEETVDLPSALAAQVRAFDAEVPFGRGVHWASSQEVAFRLVAWLFALRTLGHESPIAELEPLIARALHLGAIHTERHIDYAQRAVYNNHLLSEALLLLMAGLLLPATSATKRWHDLGLRILSEQSERQFYPDGGYIQQSHNYHRLALQVMLLAGRFCEVAEDRVPSSWRGAMARSVEFLIAHQNRRDGRLPNYGHNDGALPMWLHGCHFSDFRATLQAASLFATGQRRYAAGPWDEEAAWMLGRLDGPLASPESGADSFGYSGHHILRHGSHAEEFVAFRCGSLVDRFSQIDMLHVDVWWRGLNVLVDPGSYHYNGDDSANAHFVGTASHNTLTVDGMDQMKLHRRFKVIYWTRAKLLAWHASGRVLHCAGEHYGYARRAGGSVHRRAVLFVAPDTWLIVDRVAGDDVRQVRLHWQAGPFACVRDGAHITLKTPAGPFRVAVYDASLAPLPIEVCEGEEAPLRGWVSRTYGRKVPAPSMSVELEAEGPLTLLTLLGQGELHKRDADATQYRLDTPGGPVDLTIVDGLISTREASGG